MSTALLIAAASCATQQADDKVIDKPDLKITDGIFSVEALEAIGRVTEPVVSPDETKILYGVSYESIEENASNRDLYVMNVDGSDVKRLTRTPKSENNAVWINGGAQIAFLYPDNGINQVWVMDADGNNRKCVSNVENGVNGFLISPDEKHVVMIANVKYTKTAQDVYPDLPKASGRIIDDLMYKHWDEWVTEIPHPFLGDFDGNSVTNVYDIMQDEPYEAPMKPFGGVESFAWSPDSKQLIYVSRKKVGMEYALSTNSDLYLYDLDSKTTKNITEGMMGYDTNPVYSPDGKYVAWLSMEHDGYESDKNRIFVMDCATGEKTDLTANWDYTVDAISWAPDSRFLYFLACRDGVKPMFSIGLDGTVSVVAQGTCDYDCIAPLSDGRVITMHHSMIAPNEIYSVKDGEVTQLTEVNKELLDQVTMPTVKQEMVPTTDGKEMLTWVILPPNFDESKKYPAVLYCQGGPQQAVSQFWSYRWNFAVMASHGYVIIAPNRRGLPGFGTEWNAQISGDYGGQNMRDYLSAVDYMKEKPYIDGEHIGAAGASYGGFSVYWLAGNHDKRFACLIAHAGIFNTESQYLETEEMWFANWDLGGPFWDKSNAVAQRSFANSPHKFVDKWDTPILITHGEYDFRILASQGMMAFNAARLRGVPAEMLIFPDENHWILKPQNAVLWQRVFFRWLDHWLKPEAAVEVEEVK
ncbi:S9 family peptidase [Muribaculum sp. NM65_B17]|uniref:S9 family peptidase n=1 Tax=unclassified Muribaculum TaxID=2622126 RepID=UPI001093A27B|nr:S9 family peptidase [Muribaculum sp. NM65_B17]TGY05589.1 S9 family peptidase [Muribaculum sp. NM65_B17]THG42928.1 S9 family peptidase [Muribaculaceae bacterium]